jgi:hypothetical protein
MTKTNYYYIGTNQPSIQPAPSQLDDNFNPLLSFSEDFIDSLSNVDSISLGQSVPYISLSLLDLGGEEITNFNLDFFSKNPSLEPFKTDVRYPNRPEASLKSLQIKKDKGGISGGGYIFFTDIKMDFKIHRPEALQTTFLKAFLFLGLPLKLTYGWNSPLEFLNKKESLIFNVQEYSINFDTTNQIDFSIVGKSYSNDFLNINLGDDDTFLVSDPLKSDEARGVDEEVNIINNYLTYIQSAAVGDGTIKKNFTQPKEERRKRLKPFKSNFNIRRTTMFKNRDLRVNQTVGIKTVSSLKIHDIVKNLIEPSLKGLAKKVGTINEVRIIYGQFNDNAGEYGGKSIGEFLVPWRSLKKEIQREVLKKEVPTVGDLFNILIREYLSSKKFYKFKQAQRNKETLRMPDIKAKVDVIETIETESKKYLNIYLFDANFGIPNVLLLTQHKSSSSTQEQLEDEAKDQNLAIFKLGHTNSFIKNINISTNMDQNLRSVYMQKAYKTEIGSPRSSQNDKREQENTQSSQLILPFVGSLELLGHVDWVPFRTFYLSTSAFLIDNAYQFNSVTHTLDRSGFKTIVEFIPTK